MVNQDEEGEEEEEVVVVVMYVHAHMYGHRCACHNSHVGVRRQL